MTFTIELTLLRNMLKNAYYTGRQNHYLNELQAATESKKYIDMCIDIHLRSLPPLPKWPDDEDKRVVL